MAASDAITGLTGGDSSAIGEYLVADTQLSVIKAFTVLDPTGGSDTGSGCHDHLHHYRGSH